MAHQRREKRLRQDLTEREVIQTRGVARQSPETMAYLKKCEAVTNIENVGSDVVMFNFDPKQQPTEGVPSGVWFDLSEAPF